MPNAAVFSGWGIPAQAQLLRGIVPDSFQVFNIEYAQHLERPESVEQVVESLGGESPDLAIGWSMGGQIASTLVAHGKMQPKNLVLIATPYQLLKEERGEEKVGTWNLANYESFVAMFEKLEPQAQKQLIRNEFIKPMTPSKNPEVSKEVQAKLDSVEKLLEWRGWIPNVGAQVKFADFDPEAFADTKVLIVHANPDRMVNFHESENIAKHLKQGGGVVEVMELPEGGVHVPFLVHTEAIKQRIAGFVQRGREQGGSEQAR